MSRVDLAFQRAGANEHVEGPGRALLRETLAPARAVLGLHHYTVERPPQAPGGEPAEGPAPRVAFVGGREATRCADDPPPAAPDRGEAIDRAREAQYERLLPRLRMARVAGTPRAVMITSAMPQERKHVVALDLARYLCRSAARVLLIQADMAEPRLEPAVESSAADGLAEYLLSERRPLQVHERAPHLWIMAAGAGGPAAIAALTSQRMRELLAECTASFDWVVVDAPAVNLLPDAPLLAEMAGSVIFVIGEDIPFAQVHQAMSAAGGSRIVGTVLLGAAQAPDGSGRVPGHR